MIQELTQPAASASAMGAAFEVRGVCAALGVSPSGFYAHQHKAERPRRREDSVLTQAIEQAFMESYGTYGSPRLVRALRARDLRTSKTRVRRLMKSQGVCARQKRRVRVRTTQSNPHLPVAPHLLREAPPAQQPGERFQSDITYIPTHEGWLFLAATLDAYSRRCAGWSAGDNMETPLVLRAAQRALADVGTPGTPGTPGTETPQHLQPGGVGRRVHHSDRGSQYASELFRDFLHREEVVQSMGRKGNCYDNALIESFWATLKTECFDNFRGGIPATRAEAKQKLFAYIEVFYNRKRFHSSLGYLAPIEFENNHFRHKEENLSFSVSS